MQKLLVVGLLLGAGMALHAADAVLGTWHLNVAKSRYDPGPPPKNETRTYREENGEIKAVVVTQFKNGNTDSVYYPANYDGKVHPVSGAPDRDGIVMKRLSEFEAESQITHAGKVIGIARRTVAANGKTMTITFKGTAVNGDPVNNTAFYDKQVE